MLFLHIGDLRELQLGGMYSLGRASVVTRALSGGFRPLPRTDMRYRNIETAQASVSDWYVPWLYTWRRLHWSEVRKMMIRRTGVQPGDAARRWRVLVSCFLGAGWFACGALAADSECTGDREPNKDCGTHNMMLVGEKSAFVSHLPMFHSQHRFQVVLEVTFDKSGQSVLAGYTQDRGRNPSVKMYTVSPEEVFVLSRLWEPGDPPAPRKAFKGTVFRGHLERGGKPVKGLSGVDVRVKRVVYARELRPDAPRSTELAYILFGISGDLYAAHQISQAPDFDQILAVKLEGHPFSAADLERGVTLVVADRDNDLKRRIQEGETVEVKGTVNGSNQAAHLRLNATRELYFEEGELRKEATMDQTPAERKAGF